ncbi:MAG: helix-turn-helix transcriptional regulator [Clostridia bacterium]|nr:helix-turn-helix transcriptional regulator [Clostridia bacterium]
MKNVYDINNFVHALTEQSVLGGIIEKVKQRRKELKLTQQGLAKKSGVSYASIRRFESTGEISFTSLLKIANALNALSDFNMLFNNEIVSNLKEY